MSDSTPSAPSGGAPDEDETEGLRQQRELALACAWLAVGIALPVLTFNFGPESKVLEAAQESVVVHERLMAETSQVWAQNRLVLEQLNAELARVRAARTNP